MKENEANFNTLKNNFYIIKFKLKNMQKFDLKNFLNKKG